MDDYGNAIKLNTSCGAKVEAKTKRIFVSLEIETEKECAEIIKALKRGIYRGFDSSPYHIAPPSKVNIFINEEEKL